MLKDWEVEVPERKHLRMLAICEYVFSFLLVLCSGLFAVYPAIMRWAFETSPNEKGQWTPQLEKYFTVVCTIYSVGAFALAIASAFAGVMISRRKAWLFTLIVSGVQILFVPIGTAIGIACLITLTKPHVRAWFFASPEDPPPILQP